MAGSKAGAAKARATMIKNLGGLEAYRDRMKNNGSKGGSLGTTGGFASDIVGDDGLTGPQRARIAGEVGGRTSRRGKPVSKQVETTVEEPAKSWTFKSVLDHIRNG